MKCEVLMKTAIFNNRFIQIETLERHEIQKIYEVGKQGLLTCSQCKEAVQLYIGMKGTPYFYHYSKKPACRTEMEMANSEISVSAETKSLHGFQLPSSRPISANKQVVDFKQAKQINTPSTLHTEKMTNKCTDLSPYITSLIENGIHLDSSQKKAVVCENNAILVVASAGSGKTRVLTTRAAFLIHEKKVNPSSIMLVTFTNKAGNELKERLLHYPFMTKAIVQQVVTGTFHKILYQILHFHQPEKWPRNHLLSSSWQQEMLLKEIARNLQLDVNEFPFDAALQQISAWKNSMILPQTITPKTDWEEKVTILYKQYEEKKQKNNLYDFDDMLLGGYTFFINHPSILQIYQKRFSHILIDEFQDINKIQYEWIKLLSKDCASVYAVGDDDQAIYSFRGSDPKYLLEFEKDFAPTKTIILDHNYRSSSEIVSAAKTTILKNTIRMNKKMFTSFSGEKPIVFYPYNEEEEATMILTDIQEKIQQGYQPKDFAILYRTNANSRAIFERLVTSNLPFRIEQNTGSFYSRFIVKSMIAYLKLLVNPDDPMAIQTILPSLFLKKEVLQDIKAISILEDCNFLEGLAKVKTGFSFQESRLKKIPNTLKKLNHQTPLTAISVIEKELGFQEFITKRGNEGNVWDKGSDDIRDLKIVADKFSTIQEFVHYTDHMIAMNEEIKKQFAKTENVISLSTIHRSKGLEYKAVYILAAVDGSIPHDFALEANRKKDIFPLEEERRLLYVAMTRAKHELFISMPMHLRGKKANGTRFLTSIPLQPIPTFKH